MCCWCSEWFQTSGGATRKDLGQLLIGLESNLAVVTANGAKCFMGSRTNHTWKRWRTQLLLVHYMCVCACVRNPVTVWLCMYRCTRVHSICARTCARAYFSVHECMRVCMYKVFARVKLKCTQFNALIRSPVRSRTDVPQVHSIDNMI